MTDIKDIPTYFAGIDIGSTTLKIVVTDSDGRMLFSDYLS